MSPLNDEEPVRRSDWRYALTWIEQGTRHRLLVIGMLVFAGAASAAGLLRAQTALARWVVAALLWMAACTLLARWLWRRGGHRQDSGARPKPRRP